jgi:acyl carrier protein
VRPLTGLDEVDPCLDLYELGLDSMGMLALLVQVEEVFELDLSPTGIWEGSGADVTVRRLTGLIAALERA